MVRIPFIRIGDYSTIQAACIVEVEFIDDRDWSVDDTLKVIKYAITQWICDTEKGMDYWNITGEDLNIGDIFCYDIVDEILPYLQKRGIKSITGDSLENAVSYDTVLANPPVIQDFLDEKESEL